MKPSSATPQSKSTGSAISLACVTFGPLVQCLGLLLLERPGERNEEARRLGKELIDTIAKEMKE